MRVVGLLLLLVGMAGVLPANAVVPEIDPGSAGTAIALLSGALLVIKSSRKR